MALVIGDLKPITPARRTRPAVQERFAAEPLARHVFNWLTGKVFGTDWAS